MNTIYRAKLVAVEVNTDFEIVIAETFALSIPKAEEALRAKIVKDWEDYIESDVEDLATFATAPTAVEDGKYFLCLLHDGHYGGAFNISVRAIKIEDDE